MELKCVTLADLRKLPPESREQAYRRGYRDGWIQAIDAMAEMFAHGLSRQAAYDRCYDHAEGALWDWLRRADEDDRIEWPPQPRVTKHA